MKHGHRSSLYLRVTVPHPCDKNGCNLLRPTRLLQAQPEILVIIVSLCGSCPRALDMPAHLNSVLGQCKNRRDFFNALPQPDRIRRTRHANRHTTYFPISSFAAAFARIARKPFRPRSLLLRHSRRFHHGGLRYRTNYRDLQHRGRPWLLPDREAQFQPVDELPVSVQQHHHVDRWNHLRKGGRERNHHRHHRTSLRLGLHDHVDRDRAVAKRVRGSLSQRRIQASHRK